VKPGQSGSAAPDLQRGGVTLKGIGRVRTKDLSRLRLLGRGGARVSQERTGGQGTVSNFRTKGNSEKTGGKTSRDTYHFKSVVNDQGGTPQPTTSLGNHGKKIERRPSAFSTPRGNAGRGGGKGKASKGKMEICRGGGAGAKATRKSFKKIR